MTSFNQPVELKDDPMCNANLLQLILRKKGLPRPNKNNQIGRAHV